MSRVIVSAITLCFAFLLPVLGEINPRMVFQLGRVIGYFSPNGIALQRIAVDIYLTASYKFVLRSLKKA